MTPGHTKYINFVIGVSGLISSVILQLASVCVCVWGGGGGGVGQLWRLLRSSCSSLVFNQTSKEFLNIIASWTLFIYTCNKFHQQRKKR